MFKRFWWSYVVVFIASGCTLILEIVAGRIVAPYVGVSIYTWTSVIGVVLAGISLGNFAGGLTADRWGSRITLGVVLIAGGLASLAILPLIFAVTTYTYPPGFSLVAKIVLMTAVVFLPPSFILGMVSPVVIKLTLADLTHTGGIVGRIYACSTFGSIVGTFLTGFVLIASFGTRWIVLWVGVVLVAMGLLVGAWGSVRRSVSGGVVLALGGALFLTVSQSTFLGGSSWLASGCTLETDYYCIRVGAVTDNGRVLEQLILDHLIHSYSDVSDPTHLHYGYERVYAEVTDYVARQHPAFQALHLGGGGYTMPRYIQFTYPASSDYVIEIDPEVTVVAYQYMGLSPQSAVHTINADARLGLQELPPDRKYDLIFGDAFNDLSVPYHLTTQEFDRQLKRALTPDGFFLANVIDKIQGGRFMTSIVRTLKTVFPYVYVLNEYETWGSPAQNTYVVAASGMPIDVQRLAAVRGQGPDASAETKIMPEDVMRVWQQESRPLLLTDDYVPADNLLAPLFLERGA